MPDENEPRIETERLILRPFRLTDADDVFDYAHEEIWGRYLPVPRPYRYHDAETFVAQSVLTDWHINPTFAITLDGRVVGSMNIRINGQANIGELGWSIAPRLWGQGYMTEAARGLIRYGFEEYGLFRIHARAAADNVGSWRVMEKVGMQREARLRGHSVVQGQRYDEVVYGIMRDEFFDATPATTVDAR